MLTTFAAGSRASSGWRRLIGTEKRSQSVSRRVVTAAEIVNRQEEIAEQPIVDRNALFGRRGG